MIRITDKIQNRYRILSRIAQGGMSEIYEAQDLNSKRVCAIKFLKEELMKDEHSLIRFAHEAKVTSRLLHPNIVRVYDFGTHNSQPFIVFELIKGQTLGDKLKLKSYVSFIEACEIVIQICDVLTYIHTRGVIHRDIKPDNIYYLYDGTVKLSDFGIALDLTNKTKEDAVLIGSVHYLAPEICQGGEVTRQSDIYSLGITFYELVTHSVPFNKDDPLEVAVSQVNDPIPLPTSIVPDLPKPIERIILKATSKNLKDRYQSAKEMRDDIAIILANKNKYTKRRSLMQRIFGFRGE